MNDGVVAIDAVVSRYGGELLAQALQAALFHLRGGLVRDMAELIHAIGRLNKAVRLLSRLFFADARMMQGIAATG